MTQSIIVYRNPVEQAFWESGLILPIMASGAFYILLVVILFQIADKIRILTHRSVRSMPDWVTYLILGGSVVPTWYLLKYMTI